MINWWLIVLAVIVGFVSIGLSLYLIFYFQSEEDAGTAWLPKFICLLGMCFAMGLVLLLPYDVANRVNPAVAAKFSVQLDTQMMWQIMLWGATGLVLVVIPFTTFWYEAYDPDEERPGKQLTQSLLYTFGLCFCFALITGLLWVTVGVAEIPYWAYFSTAQLTTYDSADLKFYVDKSAEKLELSVTIFVYTVAMLCAIGWVFFFFYGGVGLVAFPVDLIVDFMNRPKQVSAAQFNSEMEIIASKAKKLLEVADELTQAARKRVNGSLRNKINTIRNEVYMLEAQQDRLIWAYTKAGGSPFVVYGSLVIGFLSIGLSVVWIVHIFIYNTLRAAPVLNSVLQSLDNTFSLFGVLFYAIFAFYLLWATFKGQIKIGLRIVFFQIHPMKPGDTLMNAFLFNVGLLLITSVAVIQFCAMSLRDYASNTAINALLNVYVLRLKGVGLVISYLQYVFVGVSILAFFWNICCNKRKKREDLLKMPKPDDV